jgi:spore coat polysaccharide biosynthesis protein SpsF
VIKITTPQEEFWAGKFGDEYIQRNPVSKMLASNTALFSTIFSRTRDVQSVVEFGANIGINWRAISHIIPEASLTGIEINKSAVDELQKWGGAVVIHNSIIALDTPQTWDFVLIKGVLIHINSDALSKVYENLVRASNRYVCVVEYYNPSPVSISYRGHSDRLFKRDFAGEIMDTYPDLKLLDYGFVYRRDPNFPQDDVTWFLMEKV